MATCRKPVRKVTCTQRVKSPLSTDLTNHRERDWMHICITWIFHYWQCLCWWLVVGAHIVIDQVIWTFKPSRHVVVFRKERNSQTRNESSGGLYTHILLHSSARGSFYGRARVKVFVYIIPVDWFEVHVLKTSHSTALAWWRWIYCTVFNRTVCQN